MMLLRVIPSRIVPLVGGVEITLSCKQKSKPLELNSIISYLSQFIMYNTYSTAVKTLKLPLQNIESELLHLAMTLK